MLRETPILQVRFSKSLAFALAVACVLTVGQFWAWVLIDRLTLFLFSVVQVIATGFLVASLLVSVISSAMRLRHRQGFDIGPLAVNIATIVVLMYMPFTTLWL